LVTNRLDEAAGAAHEAISSGRVVPSNHWRALEVVRAVEARQLPEAKDLREAYSTLRRGGEGAAGLILRAPPHRSTRVNARSDHPGPVHGRGSTYPGRR